MIVDDGDATIYVGMYLFRHSRVLQVEHVLLPDGPSALLAGPKPHLIFILAQHLQHGPAASSPLASFVKAKLQKGTSWPRRLLMSALNLTWQTSPAT